MEVAVEEAHAEEPLGGNETDDFVRVALHFSQYRYWRDRHRQNYARRATTLDGGQRRLGRCASGEAVIDDNGGASRRVEPHRR